MRIRILVPALAALLVAGCSTSEPGTPLAGDRPTSTAPSTAPSRSTDTPVETSAPTGTSSPRPQPLDLAAVDICQVVAALPLTAFGLDGRPPLADESSLFPGARQCYAVGVGNNLGLTLVAVVDEGAREYIDTVNVPASESAVAGYPTWVLTPKDPGGCFGVVDVNDGQLLFVNYGQPVPGEQPVVPQAQLCAAVPEIAAAALAALAGDGNR